MIINPETVRLMLLLFSRHRTHAPSRVGRLTAADDDAYTTAVCYTIGDGLQLKFKSAVNRVHLQYDTRTDDGVEHFRSDGGGRLYYLTEKQPNRLLVRRRRRRIHKQ